MQIVLVVVGLVAAAAAGFLVLIAPQRSSTADVERQVEATQVQIDRLRALAATPATPAEPQAAVDAAELFRLVKAMPDSVDMAGVLLELDRVATDTGIVFDAITPRQLTAAPGYQVLPVDVTFEGNFYELSDFLFRLRTLVAVRDGKLSANGRRLTATLTINAFVLGEAAAAAPPVDAAAAGDDD
jgi:Tfp pilus assembly protein PilO